MMMRMYGGIGFSSLPSSNRLGSSQPWWWLVIGVLMPVLGTGQRALLMVATILQC